MYKIDHKNLRAKIKNLFLKTMICFSGCLMSSASLQKLFCEVCSALNCSFEELVREKVVFPSYSSAIFPSLCPSFKWIFHATINQFRKVTNSFRGAAAASSASTAVSPGNPTWPAGRQVAATGFGRISPFLSVHKTFSRIDHILGYKFSLGKFKKN